MQNKNPLTKDDVRRVANDLITANGTTSSLEVKTQLRAENYEARQQEVSDYLQAIAAEDGFNTEQDHSTGTTFNVYSFATASVSTNTSTSSAHKARTKVTIQPVNTFADMSDAQSAIDNQALPARNWIVTSKVDSKVLIFDAGASRDHVRAAYRKGSSIRIQDTRARRLK